MAQLTENLQGALLCGMRGPLTYRYRLYESNLAGDVLDANVSWDSDSATRPRGSSVADTFNSRQRRESGKPYYRDVDAGSAGVSMSNFRDHTWELSITRRDVIGRVFDNLGDYCRLFVEVYDPLTKNWVEFPFGLYQMDPPQITHRRHGSSHTMVGRSPEVIVSEDSASYGYAVEAGVDILQRVRAILEARGVPPVAISFPGTVKRLATPIYFDVFQDAASVIWLRIINALLNAGGFYALYTTAEGKFTTKEIEAVGRREPDVIYTSEGPHRMVVGDITEEYDWESFSNKVTVYSGDPNQFVPVVGVAVNRDPNSPGSVQNYGRVVEKEPVQLQTIISQAEANQLAAAELKRRTSAYRKASFSTLPDPRRGPREDARTEVRRADGKTVLGGTWTITGFSWSLSSPPSLMEYEAARSERLSA